MMVTLGMYVRRGRRFFRRWMSDPRVHNLLQTVMWLTVGFFLSAASLNQRPQSLVLGLICVSVGWPALLVAAGGMLGYVVFWGAAGAQGVAWIMAGIVAAMALGGRDLRMPFLMPALAGVIVAATGVVFQLWQGDMTPVPVYLLRIVVAVLSAWLFRTVMERRDPVVDWLVCGVAVLALAQVMPIPYLGFGYIAAGFLACTGAFPAAALAGLALDLAQITPVPMTAVLSLAYPVRLIPRGGKLLYHLAPPAVFALVMSLCGVWDLYPLPGLALGSILAVFAPGKAGISHRRGETGIAQVRLEMISSVLSQTGGILQCIQEPPIDEEALVMRAVERACSSCPCRKSCKDKPEIMPTALLHRPLGSGTELPIRCRKTGRMLMELRRSQESLRTIRADRDRRTEYREAVIQQYGFLSQYLQELSDSLAKRKETVQQWYHPEVAVCTSSRENASGDRCLWFAGVEGRYYVLLCDGMGTGEEAAREGQQAGNMLRKLLCAGYPPEYALRSVNSLCALQGRAAAVTLDLAEIRLDTGKASIYKWGAAPSYVISRGEPMKIGTATPPPGLSVTDGRETVERLSLRRGETLVLLSDGAGGEEALRRAWERAGDPPGELAARILEFSRTDGSDDATVAVVRLSHAPVST